MVAKSTLRAGKEIALDTRDPGRDAAIELRNSTLVADVIRARAFNSGGRDALIIDGSTLNAASLIRLYAEGSSVLLFRNSVKLTTPLAQLAARTVEVDRDGTVAVSGRAEVFSDNHNYNRGQFGTISSGSRVTQSRFSDRPAF